MYRSVTSVFFIHLSFVFFFSRIVKCIVLKSKNIKKINKHSVARTLMDCARNIPSTEEEVSRETKRVAKALATNNYPANFIHNGRQLSRQQEINDIDHLGFVILPYAKGFSERVAKVLRDFNIKVAHKPIRTISSINSKSQKTRSRKRLPGESYIRSNVKIVTVFMLVRHHAR